MDYNAVERLIHTVVERAINAAFDYEYCPICKAETKMLKGHKLILNDEFNESTENILRCITCNAVFKQELTVLEPVENKEETF